MVVLLWSCCCGRVVVVVLLWSCFYGRVVVAVLLWPCCCGRGGMEGGCGLGGDEDDANNITNTKLNNRHHYDEMIKVILFILECFVDEILILGTM